MLQRGMFCSIRLKHLDLLSKAQPLHLGELCNDLLIPLLNHADVTPPLQKIHPPVHLAFAGQGQPPACKKRGP